LLFNSDKICHIFSPHQAPNPFASHSDSTRLLIFDPQAEGRRGQVSGPRLTSEIQGPIWVLRLKLISYVAFLITSKVLDVRRRGATTEAYEVIRRKEERSKATKPFGFAQGHELVEWQMMP
jgi:hypothetical protein